MTRNVQKSHAGMPFLTPATWDSGIGPDGTKLGGADIECCCDGGASWRLMWIIGAGAGAGGGGGGGGVGTGC